MTQKITLTLLLLMLSSFAWAGSCCCKSENPYVCKQLRFPCFRSIQADGDIDLQIDGSAYYQSVTVLGRLKSVQAIRMLVKEKTLYIATTTTKNRSAVQNQPPCRAKIRLAVPLLNQFNYTGGRGNISIQPCANYPISMNICGNPRISVNGNNIRLRKLMVGGNAQLSIYWINSCDCYLKAMDNARICLAGMVGTLEADAFQSAWINARYLRAKRAFVKSYDNARVDVRAICSLNALASQHSGIYYYQDPRFQAPYVQCAGSVVKMTQLCCPLKKDSLKIGKDCKIC